MPKTSIFFVIQGLYMQSQALLLASSLRAHLGDEPDLVGYLPLDDARPGPDAATKAALDGFGVSLQTMEIPAGAWKKPYPHGNKILAAMQDRTADIHVFMDTDMVCVAPVDFASLASPNAVSVVPEGVPSWGKNSDRWDRAYAHFNLPLPTDRVRLTRRRRIEFYPYFNAGLVIFNDAYKGLDEGFGKLWFETAHDFDFNCAVAKKRPWLDQITLPLTLARFGIEYRVLSEDYNFSISNRGFEADATPSILHYHQYRFGSEWPQIDTELARMKQALGPETLAKLPAEFEGYWTASQTD